MHAQEDFPHHADERLRRDGRVDDCLAGRQDLFELPDDRIKGIPGAGPLDDLHQPVQALFRQGVGQAGRLLVGPDSPGQSVQDVGDDHRQTGRLFEALSLLRVHQALRRVIVRVAEGADFKVLQVRE